MLQKTQQPNVIDKHVATRLAARRNQLQISMSDVSKQVGITWQMVSKYESAKNRISAGRLWSLAKVLNVKVGYFFEGL